MFFSKGRKREVEPELAPYANFVVKKAAPFLTTQRDAILDTAKKSFPKGMFERGAMRALSKYGHATGQTVALTLAGAARNEFGRELSDIEYGDCALAAHFMMRIPLRRHHEASDDIIGDWITAFEADLNYLVFVDNSDSVIDLIEQGNDRYLYYEKNDDAKLPDAYFFLLAKVLLQRENGEWQPYRFLDPMLGPSPTLLASFATAWDDIGTLIQEWMDTVRRVQKEANKNGLEVWTWW
ncbi:hypothetical protein [Mesobacterium pallidum]|uniref:hypothetical protein n=1 Tax=Mesobacterium pallidum TaxID=2872037 RepID=UPI001EE19301|nr:hypothetical protein [Mesobacterium pallidum]